MADYPKIGGGADLAADETITGIWEAPYPSQLNENQLATVSFVQDQLGSNYTAGPGLDLNASEFSLNAVYKDAIDNAADGPTPDTLVKRNADGQAFFSFPIQGDDAASKKYVDINIWPRCRTVSFTDITLSGEQTVGGVLVLSGDYVLVAGQTNTVENGTYYVAIGAWVRDPSYVGFLADRNIVSVYDGDSSGVLLRVNSVGIVGTDPLTFEVFSPAGLGQTYTAGAGIDLNANEFSLNSVYKDAIDNSSNLIGSYTLVKRSVNGGADFAFLNIRLDTPGTAQIFNIRNDDADGVAQMSLQSPLAEFFISTGFDGIPMVISPNGLKLSHLNTLGVMLTGAGGVTSSSNAFYNDLNDATSANVASTIVKRDVNGDSDFNAVNAVNISATALATGVAHVDGSGNFTSSTIVNADVSAAADIDYSKINADNAVSATDLLARSQNMTVTGQWLGPSPTDPAQFATKQYIDTLVAGDLVFKSDVKTVATTDTPLTGLYPINGYTPITDDRVLTTSQIDGLFNGIFIVRSSGWQRASDWSDGQDVGNALIKVSAGDFANSIYKNNTDPCIVGTDEPAMSLYTYSGYVGSNGISVSGSNISMVNTGVTTGTYNSVTVDITGRVTSGSNITNVNSITGTANQITVGGTAQVPVLSLPANTTIAGLFEALNLRATALSTGIAHVDGSGNFTSSTIVNADVNSTAAIAYSKLNLLNSIVNADVSPSAAIAYSKLVLSNSIVNADIVNATINLSTKVTGTLPVLNGGTGQTTYTDGQLLIGNTTGNTLNKATITGTDNLVTVTNGSGSITLTLPDSRLLNSSLSYFNASSTATAQEAVTTTKYKFNVVSGANDIYLPLPAGKLYTDIRGISSIMIDSVTSKAYAPENSDNNLNYTVQGAINPVGAVQSIRYLSAVTSDLVGVCYVTVEHV